MKNNIGNIFHSHIRWGRVDVREERAEAPFVNDYPTARPDALRWFGGLHDMEETFICQAL